MTRINPAGIFPPLDQLGNVLVSPQAGTAYTAVATGAANTVITNAPGRLSRLIVTVAGTGSGSVNIYDNATTNTGTVVAAIPATIAVGTIYPLDVPLVNGAVAVNVLNGPVLIAVYT
jgi:hypothetical protein